MEDTFSCSCAVIDTDHRHGDAAQWRPNAYGQCKSYHFISTRENVSQRECDHATQTVSEMLWPNRKLSPFRKKLLCSVVTRLHSEPELRILKPLRHTWCQNRAFRSRVDAVQCEQALRFPNIPRTACPHCFRNGRVQTKLAFQAGLSRSVCLRCDNRSYVKASS